MLSLRLFLLSGSRWRRLSLMTRADSLSYDCFHQIWSQFWSQKNQRSHVDWLEDPPSAKRTTFLLPWERVLCAGRMTWYRFNLKLIRSWNGRSFMMGKSVQWVLWLLLHFATVGGFFGISCQETISIADYSACAILSARHAGFHLLDRSARWTHNKLLTNIPDSSPCHLL